MYQPQQSFQDFAKSKGIHLLKDDIVFIKKCLLLVPYNTRRSTLETYSSQWLSGIGCSDIVHLRQNKGRFKANTYLRELVENGYRNCEMV